MYVYVLYVSAHCFSIKSNSLLFLKTVLNKETLGPGCYILFCNYYITREENNASKT